MVAPTKSCAAGALAPSEARRTWSAGYGPSGWSADAERDDERSVLFGSRASRASSGRSEEIAIKVPVRPTPAEQCSKIGASVLVEGSGSAESEEASCTFSLRTLRTN